MIVLDGMKKLYQEDETAIYYITAENENYVMPAMPDGVEEGIVKGMYLLQKNSKRNSRLVIQLLGSGTILREVLAAAELLQEFGVDADIWSVTSFNELSRDGNATTRWNMLHPKEKPRQSHVERCLSKTKGPVVAASDYVKSYADQIREYIGRSYMVLGTDGFGRSDTRERLRHFFEVDRYFILVGALSSLAKENMIDVAVVDEAISKFGIDPEKPDPATV